MLIKTVLAILLINAIANAQVPTGKLQYFAAHWLQPATEVYYQNNLISVVEMDKVWLFSIDPNDLKEPYIYVRAVPSTFNWQTFYKPIPLRK